MWKNPTSHNVYLDLNQKLMICIPGRDHPQSKSFGNPVSVFLCVSAYKPTNQPNGCGPKHNLLGGSITTTAQIEEDKDCEILQSVYQNLLPTLFCCLPKFSLYSASLFTLRELWSASTCTRNYVLLNFYDRKPSLRVVSFLLL